MSAEKSEARIKIRQAFNNEDIILGRDPILVHLILEYLESGDVHNLPGTLSAEDVLNELSFWGLDNTTMATSCKEKLSLEHQNANIKKTAISLWNYLAVEVFSDMDDENDKVKGLKPKAGTSLTLESHIKSKIWTSVVAVLILLSIASIVISITNGTIYPQRHAMTSYSIALGDKYPCEYIMMSFNILCTLLLSMDFVMRLALSRDKVGFLFYPSHLMEMLGLAPAWIYYFLMIHYATAAYNYNAWLRIFTVILPYFSVFRIARLREEISKMRIIHFLKRIVVALILAWKDLIILFTFGAIVSITFGLVIFYNHSSGEDNFATIGSTLKWVMVIMITVGYNADCNATNSSIYIGGLFASYCGIFILAVFVNVILKYFSLVTDAIQEDKLKNALFQKLQSATEN